MLATVSNWISQHAKLWLIAVLAALVTLFSLLVISPFSARLEAFSGGHGPIDLLLSYSPEQVFALIDSFGEEGRAMYRRFSMTGDVAFPLLYATFLALMISWLLTRAVPSASKGRLANLLPIAAAVFDLLENASLVTMLSAFPETSTTVARLASLFTSLKWLMSGLSGGALLIGLALAIKGGFRIKP